MPIPVQWAANAQIEAQTGFHRRGSRRHRARDGFGPRRLPDRRGGEPQAGVRARPGQTDPRDGCLRHEPGSRGPRRPDLPHGPGRRHRPRCVCSRLAPRHGLRALPSFKRRMYHAPSARVNARSSHLPFSISDCRTHVGADLRVGPPNGRTHRSTPTIAYCLLHRITLFARSSTRFGIVRPICFAALRFMMNSNFFGCSTGRSAGLASFKILST